MPHLCAIQNLKLSREPVAGTDSIVPLRKSKEAYGAIMSGEHAFYASKKRGFRMSFKAKLASLIASCQCVIPGSFPEPCI